MSINTSLENKTILVTGAKGQIGSALCNFLEENKLAPFSKTADFSKDKLSQLKNYKGLYVECISC